MAINMWPWHEFQNWRKTRFSFFHSKHLSKSFCSILALSRKVHWEKLVLFYFPLHLPSYQKLFKRPTLGDYFSREGFHTLISSGDYYLMTCNLWLVVSRYLAPFVAQYVSLKTRRKSKGSRVVRSVKFCSVAKILLLRNPWVSVTSSKAKKE